MALYAVNKPLGQTSHDVVDRLRQVLGTRRVGHTGTLDPLATGVLVLATESSTKLVPFLSAEEKEYLAWVSFGATTLTLDAEGPVVEESPRRPTLREIESVLPEFLTLTEQTPPAYSAVKVGGVKAYEAARKGEPLALPPRPVRYLETTLLAYDPTPTPHRIAPSATGWQLSERGRKVELPRPLGPYPTAIVRLVVGPGTYVRSFARDLGERLGSKAFLSGLVRTRVGRVGLEQAQELDNLEVKRTLDVLEVLSYPSVELTHTEAKRVMEGVPLPIPAKGLVALLGPKRRLIAIAEGDGFKLRIKRVFKG
ncbi:MAG: tRNA pseudouridine(55) synthase TruB [Meiothermus sp.]|uniref:tRNA pseudouridine(55) synthase TruB n=1 Tax=Meiothermus sp. TaxID=1955249 RepID=UPI0025F80D07|nr:tRNA pseudouridine(55) synthase TruB [Meiothermus sp.]MCS7058503.1 tRNA pseudouridine(55) synthase TruB [Meiothermus sp.]MCS7195102.1 tRNA pseudouridine(55) synthase TruB [Meiothermus sp.]MCX7740254.1 tRNA pseudouridine(55) synthase TruB [Meiothermus sp.]MDW8091034.1 tRNA pseudouridine(55) synthase TruB [Meiothermus sp.]MDW8480923.1 tRNA pseudouridine(55) synthase TruB [Meiothermus sp.]